MTSKEYQKFSSEEFALDEDFQNWVLHPDVKNNYFWENWIDSYPQKEATINRARGLVQSVGFRSYKLSDKEKGLLRDSIWDNMDHQEEDGSHEQESDKKNFRWQKLWGYAVAVMVGILLVFGISRITKTPAEKAISFNEHTGFGEAKTITLPDSSIVILNANSRLVYNRKHGGDREIWIEGEAFFTVRHTPDNKKFIAHTYNNVSVEVLGTRFNVNTRDENITVVLQKGSIKLNIGERDDKQKTQVYLNPGEMLSYNKQSGNYTKSDVDTSLYASWASGKLMMNDFSLSDAAQFIQETFGKKLNINDKQLNSLKISGSMPIVYSIDTMMVQFEKAFQVHFYHEGDDIKVEK